MRPASPSHDPAEEAKARVRLDAYRERESMPSHVVRLETDNALLRASLLRHYDGVAYWADRALRAERSVKFTAPGSAIWVAAERMVHALEPIMTVDMPGAWVLHGIARARDTLRMLLKDAEDAG